MRSTSRFTRHKFIVYITEKSESIFSLTHTHTPSHILSPKGYAEAQPWHPLFAKCVPSHDVIGGEPIAISGTNSRLRADTEQKNPNITFARPGIRTQDLRALPVPRMQYNYATEAVTKVTVIPYLKTVRNLNVFAVNSRV
ncbi:hypothetical protein O3G_MSEX010548 [Manduca sexta]|uniref:Uncharacterized protein n=1 Tax=Manduca sexta TaxID=7130 RepID=A0A921ZJP1_MANSE|nr:hypothetical protein O3G_MSEX010548 [Manduca sexta]